MPESALLIPAKDVGNPSIDSDQTVESESNKPKPVQVTSTKNDEVVVAETTSLNKLSSNSLVTLTIPPNGARPIMNAGYDNSEATGRGGMSIEATVKSARDTVTLSLLATLTSDSYGTADVISLPSVAVVRPSNTLTNLLETEAIQNDSVVAYGIPESKTEIISTLEQAEYRDRVRQELFRQRGQNTNDPGFLDEFGYVVEFDNGHPTAQGEGTYFTALAVVALATGNYNSDGWESANANSLILKLFDVLTNKSWGNEGSDGFSHPIRHPAISEYDRNGVRIRNRPMTKDSFGQILSACYYAFNCPNSSDAVKSAARNLASKWLEYLAAHEWRIHSHYLVSVQESLKSRENRPRSWSDFHLRPDCLNFCEEFSVLDNRIASRQTHMRQIFGFFTRVEV